MPVTFDMHTPVPMFTPAPVVNMEEFQMMARRVAEIEELLTRHVGPVYGGTQNNPHPRQQRFYREVHGPLRQSIDATHTVALTIDYDTLATQLYQAKLTFRLAAVRANLSTAASGGGSTSGSSSASSSGASSASSSAAGTSHSHSLSGVTTNAAGAAVSVSLPALSVTEPTTFAGTGASGATAPGFTTSAGTEATGGGSGGGGTAHAHSSSAASWSVDATALTNSNNVDAHTHTGPSHAHETTGTHTHTGPSHQHALNVGATYLVNTTGHTHDYTAQTVASEGSHSHTIAHTHTIAHDHSVSAHTHSLTFTTIQEGSAPSAPAVTITINSVDVTTALGGPFNSSQTDLDITQYLRSTAGEPLRGDNTIVLTSTELLDLEIVLKSFIGSADPWSAGIIST